MAVTEYDLTTEVAKRLKRQLEFYFSDSNYPTDKFLRGKAAENDGYIPINVLLTFNRLKSISQEIGLVTAVLSSCEDLEVKGDLVKRKKPIPEKETITCRSIYAKGFPVDGSVTIESIIETFGKIGMSVLSVRFRKAVDKKFKGSAYIEFTTEEDAKKLIEQKQFTWIPEVNLEILSKAEHVAQVKDRINKFKEQNCYKEELDDQKENKEDGEKGDAEPEEQKKRQMTLGLLLEVKNIPADTPLYDVKAYFAKFGKVRYVDFQSSVEGTAVIRFDEVDSSKLAMSDIAEKKLEIRGSVIEGRPLEGEEEKKFWEENILPRFNDNKRGARNSMGKRGGMRGGRSKRGSKGKGKRKQKQNEDGEPPEKRQKVETVETVETNE